MPPHPKKVLGNGSVRCADLVTDDFRRLDRKRKERKEISAAARIGTEASFEAPQGVLGLEQRDHDTFRRGMLTPADPGVHAAGCGLDRLRMFRQDSEALALLPILESEAGEPKEHGRASALVGIDL